MEAIHGYIDKYREVCTVVVALSQLGQIRL